MRSDVGKDKGVLTRFYISETSSFPENLVLGTVTTVGNKKILGTITNFTASSLGAYSLPQYVKIPKARKFDIRIDFHLPMSNSEVKYTVPHGYTYTLNSSESKGIITSGGLTLNEDKTVFSFPVNFSYGWFSGKKYSSFAGNKYSKLEDDKDSIYLHRWSLGAGVKLKPQVFSPEARKFYLIIDVDVATWILKVKYWELDYIETLYQYWGYGSYIYHYKEFRTSKTSTVLEPHLTFGVEFSPSWYCELAYTISKPVFSGNTLDMSGLRLNVGFLF